MMTSRHQKLSTDPDRWSCPCCCSVFALQW